MKKLIFKHLPFLVLFFLFLFFFFASLALYTRKPLLIEEGFVIEKVPIDRVDLYMITVEFAHRKETAIEVTCEQYQKMTLGTKVKLITEERMRKIEIDDNDNSPEASK